MRKLVVVLHGTRVDATGGSVHGGLLGQALLLVLLVLVETFGRHLGHLLRGEVRVLALYLALKSADLGHNPARQRIRLGHTRRWD